MAPAELGPEFTSEAFVSSNIGSTALGVAGLAFGLLVGYWGVKMIVTGKSPWKSSSLNNEYKLAA
ncbi:MAG: hypothetical protein QF755_06390 [Candidatus Peribacteraceae bacterium]|nr:hypothetical protein [Candidatus Peribacteraceae bacterium]